MPKPVTAQKTIDLYHLNPQNCGGHTTFAAHLNKGLQANGIRVNLIKIGKRTETFSRDFGYDMRYTNFSIEDAVKRVWRTEKNGDGASLIVAPSKPMAEQIDELIEAGARMICHDPVEFKHGWDYKSVKRPIVIRESMLKYFDNGVFLKHPYKRRFTLETQPTKRPWAGVSISRIDFRKNIDLILDANRILPDNRQIHIYGSENRLYTKFTILPKYPEWEQSVSKYPREFRYAVENLCGKSKFLVDMTELKGDGGGTQYTFLEGIDAGCVLLLNEAWILNNGVMRPDHNCRVASSGKEIAKIIQDYYNKPALHVKSKFWSGAIQSNAEKLLKQHDAKRVAKSWIKELLH